MNDNFYTKLKGEIQPYFEKTGSHSFDHTGRVYQNAMRIAEGMEDVDIDIIKVAALLHDISRKKEDEIEGLDHAQDGAETARKILEKIDFPEEKIKGVESAIRTHRYSKKLKAESREAEIIQDADRLDVLGAITIARIFDRGGVKQRVMHDPDITPQKEYNNINTTSINHFYEKILKITPESFNTPKAQELAKDKYAFTKEFVERFEKEWKGEL